VSQSGCGFCSEKGTGQGGEKDFGLPQKRKSGLGILTCQRLGGPCGTGDGVKTGRHKRRWQACLPLSHSSWLGILWGT